jgi:hypothetical protein
MPAYRRSLAAMDSCMQFHFTDFTHSTHFTHFTDFTDFSDFTSGIPSVVRIHQSLRKPTGNSGMEDCAESQKEEEALRSR